MPPCPNTSFIGTDLGYSWELIWGKDAHYAEPLVSLGPLGAPWGPQGYAYTPAGPIVTPLSLPPHPHSAAVWGGLGGEFWGVWGESGGVWWPPWGQQGGPWEPRRALGPPLGRVPLLPRCGVIAYCPRT